MTAPSREDLMTIVADAQQAVRYADKFGAVRLSEVDLSVIQQAIEDHVIRKAVERSGHA